MIAAIALLIAFQAQPQFDEMRRQQEVYLDNLHNDAIRADIERRKVAKFQRLEFTYLWNDLVAALNKVAGQLGENKADRKAADEAVKAFGKLIRSDGWPGSKWMLERK